MMSARSSRVRAASRQASAMIFCEASHQVLTPTLVAHKCHMAPADGAGVIRTQSIRDRFGTGGLRNMLKDGSGNFIQHYEVAQSGRPAW
jgi:hypothetical protein